MKRKNAINLFIALVWLVNGLFCKVLNLVPRHELIVLRILGSSHSQSITILIGISEILMAAWIISHIKPKLNAIVQIAVIALMNSIEFILVPDLLLWGKFNSLFALIFILLIWYNNFYLDIITKKEHYATLS